MFSVIEIFLKRCIKKFVCVYIYIRIVRDGGKDGVNVEMGISGI